MTKYISGELKQRLEAVVAEFTGAHPVVDTGEPIAVSAYTRNPGEYTQKLPVGERTERLALPAAPVSAPVQPVPPAAEFTSGALMQDDGDPPLYRVTAYVARAARRNPPEVWTDDEPWPGRGFTAECDAMLARFDRSVARMFADSDARRRQPPRRQVTT